MTAQTKLFFLTKCFVLLSCINLASLEDMETERLMAELQLDDLELVDACEDLAKAQKTALLSQNYQDQIEKEQNLLSILKAHYEVLRSFDVVPAEVERNWTYQVKPGDALLSENKYNEFVVYKNTIAQLTSQSKFNCQNQTESCLVGQTDYNNALDRYRDYEALKNTWINWQLIYNKFDSSRRHIELIKEVAALNEFDSVIDYWEVLIDFAGAYRQADEFWEEISPFYKKLQTFVRTRLFKFYNIEDHKGDIPAFLLGGNLGTDWSNIADIVLPHPQLHYEAQTYLNYKDIRAIYENSDSILINMGLNGLKDKFWKRSNFNATYCKANLFEFCYSDYTELSDCSNTSWARYLDAHEVALKVAVNDLDYTSLPRYHLRFCAIDDAVKKLGSILAVESLDYHGIKADDESAQMTKLLLVALRVMPRLAYSIMVDKWRIEILKENSTNVADLWWKFRKQYMGVEGIKNTEYEFLEDSKITANQPYLNEFFGILVAFQLMSYHKERANSPQNIAAEFGQDDTFLTLLTSRHTTDWPYLLTIHYGLDLSSSELIKYFEPLERYFETAPLEQVAIVTTTTTTTTTTSTTTTSTTTMSPPKGPFEINLNNEVANDEPKMNSSTTNLSGDKAQLDDNHGAMYVGVGILVVLGCVLGAAFAYKKMRRKPRSNNRRFDT